MLRAGTQELSEGDALKGILPQQRQKHGVPQDMLAKLEVLLNEVPQCFSIRIQY